MRIEDMKNWTVDQLKKEVVRLADEREAKQHVILNKNKKINDLQAELDKMCNYNDELKKGYRYIISQCLPFVYPKGGLFSWKISQPNL